MDVHPNSRPRLIRSSYGRTQLFLQECNVMFREVRMGGIVRRGVGERVSHASRRVGGARIGVLALLRTRG